MVHHARKIDLGLNRCDAEGRAAALRLGHPGGGDQRLGGHAAEIQAIAAHLRALDQHHIETELSRARGDDQPRRACAHDADVGGQHQRALRLRSRA